MKLLSESKFDIKDYYGDLVIMYPEDAEDTAKKLKELLDVSGHVYHLVKLSPDALTNRNYVSDTIRMLDGCACFVPIITKYFYAAENALFRSLIWHFIGYMRTKLNEGIVPFIPKGDSTTLEGTPIQQLDILHDEGELITLLLGKYSSKLLCNNYYKNRVTNLYASKRIMYHCLRLQFNIYESAFKNAKKYYTENISHRVSDAEIDKHLEKYIEENLICGCRIVSFGSSERLEPQMMVYKDEIHPDIEEIPETLIGKKTYRKLTKEEIKSNPQKRGVRAEIVTDILIPVHKLLGAYVKAYLTCLDKDCPLQFILALMESDFTGKEASGYNSRKFKDYDFWKKIYPSSSFIDGALGRVYFSLNFQEPENPITPEPSLRIGNKVDFVFPQ